MDNPDFMYMVANARYDEFRQHANASRQAAALKPQHQLRMRSIAKALSIIVLVSLVLVAGLTSMA